MKKKSWKNTEPPSKEEWEAYKALSKKVDPLRPLEFMQQPRRGPLETTTGMIRVKVEVQQEREGLWYARVPIYSELVWTGRTRKEAIQFALKAANAKNPEEKLAK